MEIQNNIETDEADQVPMNIVDDLPNGHDRGNNETGNTERAESQEKRTRFSLSHDEGIMSNLSFEFNIFKYIFL